MSRERNQVAATLVKKYREWKLKHPDFPLTVRPNGQWSKKVRGRTFYFGLLSDPQGALSLWLREKDYLLAGQEPPTCNSGITVEELCKQHIKDVTDRVAAGKLSSASIKEYQTAAKTLKKAGISYMPICCLTPLHFTNVLQHLENSGRRLRTQKNMIMSIKAIFNWGRKMGLYGESINYGPRFVAPSVTEIEAEQEEAGVTRFFERELILDALKIADAKMKVAILLGINCAFYPGDTKAITYKYIHLDSPIPYHDFRRVKTHRKRMAALWPETVAAIKEYTDCHRPTCKYDTILLNPQGVPYAEGNDIMCLSRRFNKLVKKVGNRSHGVSLGSLRHTYGTIMDLVTDTPMVDLNHGTYVRDRPRAGKKISSAPHIFSVQPK